MLDLVPEIRFIEDILMRINKKAVMLYFLGFLLMGIALYFVEQVKQEKREQRKIYCDNLKGEELLRVVVNNYFYNLYMDLEELRKKRHCIYLFANDDFRECNFFTIKKELNREKLNEIIADHISRQGYSSSGDLGFIAGFYRERMLSLIPRDDFKNIDMLSILENENVLSLEISSELKLYQREDFNIYGNKLIVSYSSTGLPSYENRQNALQHENEEKFNIGYCGELYWEGIYE